VMGCVTCHTCHASMTDFSPILGNPVEVTHVTSPGHVYSFPHLGTCQILHVFFFLQTITSSKHHFLNFFCVSGTHWGLAPSLHSRFPTLHWISSVALPPFATQSMYTQSRCPTHLMISPLTGMLMNVSVQD